MGQAWRGYWGFGALRLQALGLLSKRFWPGVFVDRSTNDWLLLQGSKGMANITSLAALPMTLGVLDGVLIKLDGGKQPACLFHGAE